MFISVPAIQELTGYTRHADQRRWLTIHGWRFEVSRIGRPIVSAAYAESKLSDAEESREWKPNRSFFKKMAA